MYAIRSYYGLEDQARDARVQRRFQRIEIETASLIRHDRVFHVCAKAVRLDRFDGFGVESRGKQC